MTVASADNFAFGSLLTAWHDRLTVWLLTLLSVVGRGVSSFVRRAHERLIEGATAAGVRFVTPAVVSFSSPTGCVLIARPQVLRLSGSLPTRGPPLSAAPGEIAPSVQTEIRVDRDRRASAS